MLNLNVSIIPRGSHVRLLRPIRMSCGARIDAGTEFHVVRSFVSLRDDQTPVVRHRLQAISSNGTRDYVVNTKFFTPEKMALQLELLDEPQAPAEAVTTSPRYRGRHQRCGRRHQPAHPGRTSSCRRSGERSLCSAWTDQPPRAADSPLCRGRSRFRPGLYPSQLARPLPCIRQALRETGGLSFCHYSFL